MESVVFSMRLSSCLRRFKLLIAPRSSHVLAPAHAVSLAALTALPIGQCSYRVWKGLNVKKMRQDIVSKLNEDRPVV